MGKLYPMPGDTHTGKDLEYIKDMISGISLQIAGVAISNNPADISCEISCDIRFINRSLEGFDKPGVADVSFSCPNRICKKSITFDSLNSFNVSQHKIKMTG